MGKKRRLIANPQKFGAKYKAHPASPKTTDVTEEPVAEPVAEPVVEEEVIQAPTLKAPPKTKTSEKAVPKPAYQKGIKKKSTK